MFLYPFGPRRTGLHPAPDGGASASLRRLAARDLARRAWSSTDVRWAVGLGALALVLRLAFVLAVDRESFVFNDTLFYHNAARSLAEGQGYTAVGGGPTAQWPPGFSFVLSLVYRVTGPNQHWGEVLNAFIGALTVPALYALALRTFGRREARWAAAGLALLPGHVLWADVLVAETLYSFLLVAFFLLAALLPRAWWAVAALGVAVGLAMLTRGEALLLIPAVIAIWWPQLERRRLLAFSAGLVAVVLLTLAPWTIRNAIEMDSFVPLSTNSSTTLWSGHNPDATGAQIYAPESLLSQIYPRGPRREIEEGRLLRREAIDFMVHNPGRELELIPLKLFNLNRGDSWAMEWVNAGDPGKRPFGDKLGTPVRVIADTAYYALLAATVASILLFARALWRNAVTRGVLVLFAGSLVMFGFVYYGNYRYRVPLEPLMLLVASPLLAALPDLRGRLGGPGEAAGGTA
jgi:4-amino-4-deoxy-L-arabinose transferase-like glycosyltransferase